ncbi:MAG: hypothetical protein ABI855_04760 [Bacteroidota bacterium]
MKFPIIYLFIIISVFFLSCGDKNNSVSPNNDYSYFPSNVGHEIIYDVDSISKSAFKLSTDTFHFQIKEVIESTFTDNEGRPALRLERYRRSDASQPWEIFKVWTANVTGTNAEKKEDNITFIKLVFPVALNQKWNGNVKNDMDAKEYKYTAVNSHESFNSISFDSALTVLQKDLDDRIYQKDYEIEKYATGIGMFFRESFNGMYNSQITPSMLTLQDSLNEYTHYTEKMISYTN